MSGRARKRRRRAPARKRVRRSRFKRRRMPLFRTPIPKQMRMKFRYTELITLDPTIDVVTASAAATANFRANSLFDPQAAIGGHQPLGFDQYMPFYTTYTVVASSMRAVLSSGNSTTPVIFTLSLEDTTDAPLPLDDEIENGRISWKVVTGRNASGIATRSKRFSARKFFGKKFIVGSDGYEGTEASSPDKQAFYQLTVLSVDGANPEACKVRVFITYWAVLTEAKTLLGS